MGEGGYAVVDFGRFCTGFLVVMGVGKLTLREYAGCVGGRVLIGFVV